MKRFLLALLVLVSASRAVDTLSIPTNYLTVTTGTRATLAGNFTAIETWGNKVRDSIAQVTARLGGYTGNLAVTSLSNLRLKLDGDNSETARLLVESGNGDSLFTVREDSTAKFYGNLTVNGTSTLTGAATLTTAPTLSALTASLPVFTNGSKALASNAMSGTGSVVMSSGATLSSPTLSGTVGGSPEFSGAVAFDQQIEFAGFGTTGTSRIFRTAADGISIRGVNGSSNAFALYSHSGSLLFRNPASTSSLTIPAQTTFGDSILGVSQRLTGSLTADSLISSKFYEENTFTGTLTGVSGTVTGTFRYVRVGKQVTLSAPYLIGTSNTTACTITGMPAAIRPARKIAFMTTLMDNGSGSNGALTGFEIETSGTLTLYLGGNASGFTGSGSKGLVGSVNGSPAATEYTAFSYTLQ